MNDTDQIPPPPTRRSLRSQAAEPEQAKAEGAPKSNGLSAYDAELKERLDRLGPVGSNDASIPEKYENGGDFEDSLLACLVAFPDKFLKYAHTLNSGFFTGVERIATARGILNYWRKYDKIPGWPVLRSVVFDSIARTVEGKDSERIYEYIDKLTELDTSDSDYVSSRTVEWARNRAFVGAYNVVAEAYAKARDDKKEIPDDFFACVFEAASRVGKNINELEVEDCATAKAEPLPEVLIDGIAHRGSKMVVGGGSKMRKTWTLIDLAASIASGTNWWGRKCTQGSVLYVNFELARPFFKKRLDAVLKAKGVTLQEGKLFHWCLRGKIKPVEEMMPAIITRAVRLKVSTVILDPLYKLMLGTGKNSKDENSATDWANVMNELEKLTEEAKCLTAFGAHFSKGNQAGKESMDRISGSGVSARDPDTILTMTQHDEKDTMVIDVTARNLPPVDPFCVRWNFPLFDLADDANPDELKQAKAGANQEYPDSLWLKPLPTEAEDPMARGEWRRASLRHCKDKKGKVMSDSSWRKRAEQLIAAGLVIDLGAESYVRSAPKGDR